MKLKITNLFSNFTPLEGFIILHLFVPLTPFLLGALVRIISFPKLRWSIVDASELSLSMGFVLLFLAQKLWTITLPLMNDDKKEELDKEALRSLLYSVIFIILFTTDETFNTIVYERNGITYNNSLFITHSLIFIFTAVSVRYIVRIQKSYKLKARL